MTIIRAALTGVLALGLLAAPLAAGAQHAERIYRLGLLGAASASSYIPARSEEFKQGLRDLGFVDRGNITIEYRWAGGQEARLADLAAELVRLKVEVIVAADQEAARVARGVTTRIPIVTVSDGDPVWRRLIASLLWRGGQLTEPSSAIPPWFGGKWVELLTETIPKPSRIAFLWNPSSPAGARRFRDAQRVSQRRGVNLLTVEVERADKLDAAFAALMVGRPSALIVDVDPIMTAHAKRVVRLVKETRLPAVAGWRAFADEGGLLSYGPSLAHPFRQAGRDAAKLLKGTRPADLPVAQPTKLELVINLKTARALGLTIPPSLLLRADQVIE